MASRIAKETHAIELAIGKNIGQIFNNIGMICSAFVIAFTRGWIFSFAMLGMFPFMGISGFLFAKIMASGTSSNLRSYAQSAGYAEQALSSIRVVAANGQEKTEIALYNRFLDRVKKNAMAGHIKAAISFAFVWLNMYSGYSYALYIASWFIEK
jgi:ATP-binding cassette subfamily B (MDR/TAP) protein 1